MASIPVPESDRSPFQADVVDRKNYIGGSEAHALLNESLYGSGCARELGYDKSGTPEDVSRADAKKLALSTKEIMEAGHDLEDIAVERHMRTTARTLIRRNRLVMHPLHAGAAVHTDRIILKGNGKPTGDCEVKSKGEGPFLNILRNGVPSGHLVQLQWSLWITGHSWGSIVIMGVMSGLPMKYFDVDADITLHEIFARETEKFWQTLKAGNLPPQLPDPHDLRCRICRFRLTCRGESLDPAEYRRLLEEREGRRVLTEVNNDELDTALADRALILSEMQALDHDDAEDPGALQLINTRIRELLGEVEAAAVNHHWKVYMHDGTWSGLDIQRLRTEQPDVYEKFFVKARPTGRKVMRVYAMRNGKFE